MTDDRSETANQALEHAWNWFSLHAAQRMQTFHFFLVATAFLMAAYAALLEKHRWVALVVACVGAWIAFWFTRLDNRTWQLIKAGEDVLKICQSGLAKSAGIPALDMLQAVERPTDGASSYRIVIGIIEWTIVVVFLLAAAYAGFGPVAVPGAT